MSTRLAVYGLLALAVAGAFGWTIHTLREQARQEAIRDVERANRESERKAGEGQSAVDACYRDGGVWSRSRGLCEHPAGQ